MSKAWIIKFRKDGGFTYAAKFAPDPDGGFVVTFRDVSEAITQGETVKECYEQAAGALQAAVETYIAERMPIPAASAPKRGEHLIALPVRTALKASVYIGMEEKQMTNVALAKVLRVNEKEVRRMLDPRHPTKAETLERAAAALGKRVEIRVH